MTLVAEDGAYLVERRDAATGARLGVYRAVSFRDACRVVWGAWQYLPGEVSVTDPPGVRLMDGRGLLTPAGAAAWRAAGAFGVP